MLRAVIFDIDGTLVDSNDLHARAWQKAFERFGFQLPFAQVRSQIGKGGDQLIPALIPDEDVKRIGEQLSEHRSGLFKAEYLQKVHGFPKVRALFEQILNDGRRIGLASSAKEEELAALKQAADIADLIDEQTSSDDAEKSKPHPDIVEAALRRLRVQPDEAIFVGDTPYDAIAATRLHVRTIGVLCGGFPESELRKAGCIEIYNDPADLLSKYEVSALAEARRAS